MEVIKKRICLENSRDRLNQDTWGELSASTFYVNVLLTQNIDDMGMFTDLSFIPKSDSDVDYSILIDKLNSSGITSNFMFTESVYVVPTISIYDDYTLRLPQKTIEDYFNYGELVITASTDSKIDAVRSYDIANPFKIDFVMGNETYFNYKNQEINGVNKITSLSEPKKYVIDANNDVFAGTIQQKTGLLYSDYTGETRNIVINNTNKTLPLTNVSYIGEGWNETNSEVYASYKEEYLFGIISPPEIKSEVFIDRGATSVLDRHLRLSEIKNLNSLTKYGNGFYNIQIQ